MFVKNLSRPCYNILLMNIEKGLLYEIFLECTSRFNFSWNIKINDTEVEVISSDLYKDKLVVALNLDDGSMVYPMTIEYTLMITHKVKYFNRMINRRYGEMEIITEKWFNDGNDRTCFEALTDFKLIETNFTDELCDSILKVEWVSEAELNEKIKLEDGRKKENIPTVIDVDYVEVDKMNSLE